MPKKLNSSSATSSKDVDFIVNVIRIASVEESDAGTESGMTMEGVGMTFFNVVLLYLYHQKSMKKIT